MADTQPDAKIISKLCVYENQHEKCSLQGCSCRCHQTTQPDDLEAEVEGLLPCPLAESKLGPCPTTDNPRYWCGVCRLRPAIAAALRKQRERADHERKMREANEQSVRDLERQLADWRKGVEFIASAAKYDEGNLSCVDIGERVLAIRAENESLTVQLAEAKAERDKYHDALIARHGGEPVALLSELDEARERLAEAKAEIARLRK